MIIRPYPPQGGSGFPHASYRVWGPAPNADTGGTRVHVYTYDNIMSWRAKRGHRRRKYIYGPGVDEPISMIEAGGSYAGTYYYHFDGLGSVVALTSGNVDHMGETVQVYEYDVYGRVGATDASHPNRILFTGREYDKETGLYYYRARYYNPQIGRFLQTDPIGYGDGMNWYTYCGNNAVNCNDPLGESGNWEDLSFAGLGYRVRNGDDRIYFTQPAMWACAPTSVANLYIARGYAGALTARVANAYPETMIGGGWPPFSPPWNHVVEYCEIQVESKLKNKLGYPLYAKSTSLMPQHPWNTEGVPNYGPVGAAINSMGDFAYRTVQVRAVASFDLVTDYIHKAPVLMAFKTNKSEENGGKRSDPKFYHSVVVRWAQGAQSHRNVDGKEVWVSTPYEIIDPMQGKLYFTAKEFKDLLGIAGGEMLVGE